MLEIFFSSDFSEPVLPSTEEAREMLDTLMLSSNDFLHETFIKAPLLYVTLIRDTERLYGLGKADESIVGLVARLYGFEKADESIAGLVVLIWLFLAMLKRRASRFWR